MKSSPLFLCFLLSCSNIFAQWTTSGSNIYNTNAGNVGIGTSSPSFPLTISTSVNGDAMSITNSGSGNAVIEYFTTGGGATYFGQIPSTWGGLSVSPSIWESNKDICITSVLNQPAMGLNLLTNGYIGIGITNPSARLHINDVGVSSSSMNQYNGNLIVEGNTGGRSATLGAQLEFVIPANTDGSNPWGQARIITVAGDNNTGSATGKLIVGTRRYFNKGAGMGWNYGDDLVIDGSGNVGVGTSHPQSLFSVEGTITAKQLNILQTNWSDFVFDSTYVRMPLESVSRYIKLYKHLPQVPSEAEVRKDGLDVGAMQKLQMQKIEELTLYVIDAERRARQQDSLINKQRILLDRMEAQLNEQAGVIKSLKRRMDL